MALHESFLMLCNHSHKLWKFKNEELITSFNGKQYPVCVRECENKWEQFLNRSFPNAPLSEVNESKDEEDIKESDDDSEENSDDEGGIRNMD